MPLAMETFSDLRIIMKMYDMVVKKIHRKNQEKYLMKYRKRTNLSKNANLF